MKTILQKDIWSISSFLENKEYRFNKENILTHLPEKFNMTENNNEDRRPSKMIGVLFPKAKYGVIVAIIIIISVNLIYYKEIIFSFLR